MPISTPHSPTKAAGLPRSVIDEEWVDAAAGKTLRRTTPEEPGITK
jgi:hypothetical protein